MDLVGSENIKHKNNNHEQLSPSFCVYLQIFNIKFNSKQCAESV